MSYFDLLTDDVILKILDSICNDIEPKIEKLENLEHDYYRLKFINMPDDDIQCVDSDYKNDII